MTEVRRDRVWLITGASGGMGRALAEAVLERGDRAVLGVRRPEQVADLRERFGGRAMPQPLDVTSAEQRDAAVRAAVEASGRIDVLVNNAGYGLLGAVEELADQELRDQLETNFFGAFALTQAVLPHMRAAGAGHIVNISSEGGIMGVPGAAAYNASKFALEGFSEALAHEAAPLGIRVTIVEPGAFRTGFAGRSLRQARRSIPEYAPAAQVRAFVPTTAGKQEGDPARLADALLAAVDHPSPPLRLVLGADAIEHVTAKLDGVRADIAAWEQVSRATAFRASV